MSGFLQIFTLSGILGIHGHFSVRLLPIQSLLSLAYKHFQDFPT